MQQISTYIVDKGSWVSLMMNDDDESEMSGEEVVNKEMRKAQLSM